MHFKALIRATVVIVLLHASGCSKKADLPPPAEGPNVLLILVDTLRADRLGCYGSELGATPYIDALAAESVRFEGAYAHAPWTLPSVASLFTSLTPAQHGAGGQVPTFRKLEESVTTAAEIFRDAGYATACLINVFFLQPEMGMVQGFSDVDCEGYDNNVKMRDATQTTDAAVKWLREPRDRPFFLFVHYFDPHLVYDPPDEYRARFAAPEDRRDTGIVFGTVKQIADYRAGGITFDPLTIERAEKLYNGEVAYTDNEVGRLLAALDEMKLADSTIVVFTSDHGEEFLDHGRFEHGHTLYNELVHVPLTIRYAKELQPRVVGGTAGLVDVLPTLCTLTGVTADPGFTGRDLFESSEGDAQGGHAVYFEGNFWGDAHRAWLHEGYKLIVTPNTSRLYNVRIDPKETTDLSGVEQDRLRKMLKDMNLARAAMLARHQTQGTPAQLTPEDLERLRALGYVGDEP